MRQKKLNTLKFLEKVPSDFCAITLIISRWVETYLQKLHIFWDGNFSKKKKEERKGFSKNGEHLATLV
jgi:hypothetical protein